MATGAVSSMEALVRWQHPTKGLLEPLDFIPLAEESGLILRLGEMIIHKVSQQMACWSGREWNPVPVSINVSPRQFHETDLAKVLFQSLASHHIDPKLVEIELTESSMMRDSPEVANALSQIKNIGVKLLLDDFGTGYSSLSQLQRLDVNVLKVGRSFILGMERTEKGNVFFKAIITMSHALGMRVVAEGVENEWQLEMLKLLQCDEIQGFYVCRPLPAAEVEAVLSKWMRAGTRAGIRNACVAPRESERLASRDVDRM
jgi:EAL domain-containing protein (putative c-di-GMP-specific phosphodiesterase class I)